MIRRLLPIALMCLPLACAGGTGRGSGNDAGVACASNTDCPSSYTCTQGVCTAKGTGPTCTKGSCPAHQFCGSDGTCHGSGTLACQSSADCGGGFTCDPNTGLCVQSCVVNSDCATNEVCNNNLKYCAECSFDTDCQATPSRPHCNQATGQCVACLLAGQCPAGQYCAQTGSAHPDTCQPGCLTSGDCGSSSRCDRPGTDPGKCVQCTVSTELSDCTDPAKPVCDPNTLTCVQCVQSNECTNKNATVCDTKTETCVQCLDDTTCAMGQVCVGASDTCQAGCVDTTGGPPTPNAKRCPPPDPTKSQDTLCNPNMGPNGTCVACIQDSDCSPGNLCDRSTGRCAPGCQVSATCPKSLPICDALANSGKGKCVQCRSDSDCTVHSANLHCDLTSSDPTYEQCVCIGQGNRCTQSAQCGDPVTPNPKTWACQGFAWCVAQVGCPTSPSCTSGNCLNWVPMTTTECGNVCSDPAGGSGCPSGYVCRYVHNEQQLQGGRCVPSNICP